MAHIPFTRKIRRARSIYKDVEKQYDRDGFRFHRDDEGWEYYGSPEFRRYHMGRMKTGALSSEEICFLVFTDTAEVVYCDRMGNVFDEAMQEKIREWAGDWVFTESARRHYRSIFNVKPTIHGKPAW
ncbi:MAG: hypothetical protein ACPHCI_01600 [Solirubrobacterales bacterium]